MDIIVRHEQIRRLEELLYRALRGQMQVALVSGEPGVGKTTLLETFLNRVQHMHPEICISQGKCFQVAGAAQDPYAPFVQLLDGVVSSHGTDSFWNRLRMSLVDIAPDWLQNLPGGQIGAAVLRKDQVGDQVDQQRRMVQYANALRLASQNAPLILTIDDIQWSDQASLDLMNFLTDHMAIAPILMILLHRPIDTPRYRYDQIHHVHRAVTQWKRVGKAVEIELAGFSKEDIRHMIEQQKYLFPAVFIERLWNVSQGNPLYLREFLRLLRTRGQIQRATDGFILTEDPQKIDLPLTVEAVLQQRLEWIAADLREVLARASVQGERFAAQVLSGTLQAAPDRNLLKHLNQLEDDYALIGELESQNIVVKVGSEYQFVHALLQQVLYQDLSDGQRRLLHQVIARLLESLYGTDSGKHAGQLANHYELGGNPARAMQYYFLAAQNATAVQAFDDALQMSVKAQELARHLQAGGAHTVQWLTQSLLQEAEIHFFKGSYPATLAACYEGERLCEGEGLTETTNAVAESHAQFLYWQARALRATGHSAGSLNAARKALEVLKDQQAPRLRGLLLAYLGSTSDTLPVETLETYLSESLRIGEMNSIPDVRVKALLEMGGLALYRTDRPAEAVKYAAQAGRVAAENGMFTEEITALRQQAFALLREGHFSEALACDQKAVGLARQHNLPVALHLALFSLALTYASGMENLLHGLELLHSALDTARDYKITPNRNLYGGIFNLNFALGHWQDAQDAREQYYKSIESLYPRGLGNHMRMQGHSLFTSGDYPAAVEAYRGAINLYNQYSPDARDARTVEPYLGLALVEVGEDRAALSLLEDTCDYWKGRHPAGYARSLCALAAHALKREDCAVAIQLLRQAQVAAENAPSDPPFPVRPQISLMLARALLRNNEKEEALTHARWAYDRYKRMGHFETASAALQMGQIYLVTKRSEVGELCFLEARQRWTELGLTHRLRETNPQTG